jgi:hypothetical protein
MASEAALSSIPAAPGLTQAERVADIFVAPSKSFEDIRRNATWWLPFLLLVIFSSAVGYSVQKQVGFERAYTNHLHDTPTQEDRINQLPPEQKAHTLEISAKITAGFTYGFPVLLALGFALYSLILWAAFNFGLGAETTYGQVYAVTWYAALPYLLTSLLTIITLWFGGSPETYDYTNPVGTNLAFYLPDAGPAVKALLSALDLIKLWSLALQVIGMAIIAKKTIMQSALIVVGWFVFVLAIGAGLAAAFS